MASAAVIQVHCIDGVPGRPQTFTEIDGVLDCEHGEESRDQSPIRSRSSHWRNSPLKPMLSAIWKLEMTHRSICLPDFRQFRRFADTPSWIGRDEKQTGRARRV